MKDILNKINYYKLLNNFIQNKNPLLLANSLLYQERIKKLSDEFLNNCIYKSIINNEISCYHFKQNIKLFQTDIFNLKIDIYNIIFSLIKENIICTLNKHDFVKITTFINSINTIYEYRFLLNFGIIDRLEIYLSNKNLLINDFDNIKFKNACDFYLENFEFFNSISKTNFTTLKLPYNE